MSAPTDSKASLFSRLVKQGRRFYPRLSPHWGVATAPADDDQELSDRTPATPTLVSSPSSWTRAAHPFTPLRAARPASPVLTHTPLTLRSWGSSSSTLGDCLERYAHQDNALRTPSGDNSDVILDKKHLEESTFTYRDRRPPSPSSSFRRPFPSSPPDDYDKDEMDVIYDSTVRSPHRYSRSPSPTASVRGLPPSSPRSHDDDDDDDSNDDADYMDVADPQIPAEQDTVAADEDEDMLDVAFAPDAPAATLTANDDNDNMDVKNTRVDHLLPEEQVTDAIDTYMAEPVSRPDAVGASSSRNAHPLAESDDALDSLLVAGTFSYTRPDTAQDQALAYPAARAVHTPTAAQIAPKHGDRSPLSAAHVSARPSRPHLPLPVPVTGKRAYHDSHDEDGRPTKKTKEQPATQPATQLRPKRERRAAGQRAMHKVPPRADKGDDHVTAATELMEVDDGAVGAPDTSDRDWTPGMPIVNVDANVFSSYIKRRTDVSELVVDWKGSVFLNVNDRLSGERQFIRYAPAVLSKINARVKTLVLGDSVPDEYLDALKLAEKLDADELVIRVSGRVNPPLFHRIGNLLSLPSLRRVIFVSVRCSAGTRHAIPWEYVEHLLSTIIATVHKPDVDHSNVFVAGANNHRKELSLVGNF
ncbi:hypothetical protein EXIGLDRAFT_746569 [Exidia glandulosa HHB12029]|uniref:Uncharacterized protein n=1 Tax=Exidia glandulosa HHB12029 TaxID=1314781 RepID=A0A165LZX9_EXIGL|nr:hypothetical protein EXIGLDRAFT_746569 [Exidia glandulosa HHB12029]